MGAGWLVQHGVWTEADATTYVAAAAMALVALGWSLWSKYRGRVKLLTALTMPQGTTEGQVKAHIAGGGLTPAVSTPTNIVPIAGI